MTKLPVFTTERLILREVTEADAPSYEKNFVDYEIISQIAGVPQPFLKGGILDFLRSQILPRQGKDRWLWGIILKGQPNEIIGTVDLWRTPNPANRVFWLGRTYWGQGIITEAVIPITDYAFDSLGFERLFFSNAVGNERSRRVKEKTGARLLGRELANPSHMEREIWELTKVDSPFHIDFNV